MIPTIHEVVVETVPEDPIRDGETKEDRVHRRVLAALIPFEGVAFYKSRGEVLERMRRIVHGVLVQEQRTEGLPISFDTRDGEHVNMYVSGAQPSELLR